MIFPSIRCESSTRKLQRPKVSGLYKSTLLGKSTTGWSVKPGPAAFGGVFGAAGTFAFGSTAEAFALGSTAGAFALGPTADPFAWDSTVAAFANRWLVTGEVIEEAFATAGVEDSAPEDALAVAGVEDPAPEDALAALGVEEGFGTEE